MRSTTASASGVCTDFTGVSSRSAIRHHPYTHGRWRLYLPAAQGLLSVTVPRPHFGGLIRAGARRWRSALRGVIAIRG